MSRAHPARLFAHHLPSPPSRAGRTGKQCRERWCNNLDPTLKKGAWSPEEDQVILQMHAKLGTRWAEIAKCLPGRSDNSVKNRWYSTCSRVLRQQQEAMAAGAIGSTSHFDRVAKLEPEERQRPSARPKAGRQYKDASASMEDSGRISPSTHELSNSTPGASSTPSKTRAPRNAASPRERKRKAPASSPIAGDHGTPTPSSERAQPRPRSLRSLAADGAAAEMPELSGDAASDTGLKLPLAWKPLSVTPPELADGEFVPGSALSAEVH